MEQDKSDPTAIILTYQTTNPKKPTDTITIYAESREVFFSSILRYFWSISLSNAL